MSLPIYKSAADVSAAIRQAIEAAIPDAVVQVSPGNPGHFEIQVVSKSFQGRSMVHQQQMVYGAIAELMRGDDAPVHAVDRLRTSTS